MELIFDIPYFQEKRYPQSIAFSNYEQGRWEGISISIFCKKIELASALLLREEIQVDKKIIIIGKSGSYHWSLIDYAAMQLGIIVVPVLSGISWYQLEYILEECNAKHIFYASKEDKNTYAPILKDNYKTELLDKHFFDKIETVTESETKIIQQRRSQIKPEDLATIIYTSGTTGEPKGVMLSHKNIISNVKAIMPLLPDIMGKRVMSFLPLSHIFERVVSYTMTAMGGSIFYTGGAQFIEECLPTCKPHYLSAVPRLVEKMLDKVMEHRERANPIFRKILDWALEAGNEFEGEHRESITGYCKRFLADQIVFRRWRSALGGNVEGIIVGAAALQPSLSRLFSAARIPIREGYGCTETSPVIAFNRFTPGQFMYGTVGIPLPGVEVKIEKSDDEFKTNEGEILVKGPNVMMGYYLKPELTADVFTSDGWYRTGDIGHFEHKWFLKITDRKRDIFKTSNGRYVAPQVVENQLKTSAYIDQCIVFGLGKPHVVALIVPNFHILKEWCEQKGVHWTAPQYMVHNPKVQKHYTKLIASLNEYLQPIEQVVKFQLLHEEWTVQNDELTPTLKVRRRIVAEKFTKQIEDLYH